MPPANTAIFPANAATIADLLNQHDSLPSSTQPTLTANITATATTFTVASGTGVIFPTDNFVCSIDDEIIFVAARVSDTFSGCVRGAQGTTAAAHTAAANVNANITAWHHNQNASEIIALESWNAWRTSPDRPPTTPGTLDDEFNAATLDTSRWTWQNQGPATTTLANSLLTFTAPQNTNPEIRAIYQTTPTPPYRITTAIRAAAIWANYAQAGLMLGDPTGKLIYFDLEFSVEFTLAVSYFTNPTTLSFTPFKPANPQLPTLYTSIYDDGTNLNFEISNTTSQWVTIYSASRTAFLTSGPTRCGLAVNSQGNGSDVQLVTDWFRSTTS